MKFYAIELLSLDLGEFGILSPAECVGTAALVRIVAVATRGIHTS